MQKTVKTVARNVLAKFAQNINSFSGFNTSKNTTAKVFVIKDDMDEAEMERELEAIVAEHGKIEHISFKATKLVEVNVRF